MVITMTAHVLRTVLLRLCLLQAQKDDHWYMADILDRRMHGLVDRLWVYLGTDGRRMDRRSKTEGRRGSG